MEISGIVARSPAPSFALVLGPVPAASLQNGKVNMTEASQSFKPAEGARLFAIKLFRQYPRTSESLDWLAKNISEFQDRISDFDVVVTRINELLKNPESTEFSEITKLREVLGQNHIPSLLEAEKETVTNFSHHSPALKAFFQGKKEFGWADDDYDIALPAKSAMGIFLEGFGRYVGLRKTDSMEKAQKIQYAFVEAFEAILLMEHPQSALLADVKDWMKSDYHKFSKPIQEALNSSV